MKSPGKLSNPLWNVCVSVCMRVHACACVCQFLKVCVRVCVLGVGLSPHLYKECKYLCVSVRVSVWWCSVTVTMATGILWCFLCHLTAAG